MNQYEILGDPALHRQLVEIIQYRCVKTVSKEMARSVNAPLTEMIKKDIERDLFEKIKEFIVVKEIDEFNELRIIGEISLPLISNEKIKELNNDIYYLNEDALKQRIEIKRLNDWIKQPWYKKLYWRLK